MDEWRRLHPVTILKELGTLAWAIVAALVFDFEIPGFVPGELVDPDTAIALLAFGYAVTRYLFTSYRLTERTLELRRGVLVKTEQTMPRDRIQAVSLNTGLLGRLVGVRTVVVSAADTEDVVLSYVTEEAAADLRASLIEDAQRLEGSDDVDEGGAGETTTSRVTLSRIAPRSLVLYALTETGLVVGAVLFVATVVVVSIYGFAFVPLVALVFAGLPLLRVFGLVGFESAIDRERLHVSRGLLSRHESASPLRRIQAVQVGRPLFRRWGGYETVTMSTGDANLASEQMPALGMVAPLVPIGEWRELVHRLIGRVELGETDLARSSPLTVRRVIVRGVVLTAVLASVATIPVALWDLTVWLPVSVAAVGVGLTVPYARRRYRVMGWAENGEHLMVRRGVVDRKLSIVPIRKVQDVEVRQTFFQRRLGIATVMVDTAGLGLSGAVTAVDLDEGDAAGLARRLVGIAARIALPDGV